MGKSTICMVIFNSYVKLPEGIDVEFIRILYFHVLDDAGCAGG